MSYFNEIYIKRGNRFGTDYQSRIQGQREYLFEHYLKRSVYTIEFDWNNEIQVGSFEKYKQDNTETLHYLLTRIDVNIPNGTILELPNKDGILKPWMVYYLERIKASGYNRYIMLRMTHWLTWKNRAGQVCSSWAYMYGQEDNMLKDELRSRSRMDTLYTEALKMSFFVLPATENIRKDDYIEVNGVIKEAYVVTGYDIQSAEGVEYVTVDPVYLRDLSPVPKIEDDPGADPADYYWLQGEDKR